MYRITSVCSPVQVCEAAGEYVDSFVYVWVDGFSLVLLLHVPPAGTSHST